MVFDCMVQQRPQRSDSGMFPDTKWQFAPRSEWPPVFNMVRAWDLASTKGGGDYTCGTLVGRAVNGDIYIYGRVREQFGSDEVRGHVKATAEHDGHAIPVLIEQERSGAGANIVEFFKRELLGWQVEGARAEGTKEQRATPYSILQQGGHVWLPSDEEDEEWVQSWIKEHSLMTGDGRSGPHDDQIDTAAYAVNYLLDHGIVEIKDPNDPENQSVEAMLAMDELLSAMGLI
jgi:predicted phage terminase large subunit-like protein